MTATENDLLKAKELAASMSLKQVRAVSQKNEDRFTRTHDISIPDFLSAQLMKNVLAIHEGDPNFPHEILQKIKEFMGSLLSILHLSLTIIYR